jgi:hypothetical protein
MTRRPILILNSKDIGASHELMRVTAVEAQRDTLD